MRSDCSILGVTVGRLSFDQQLRKIGVVDKLRLIIYLYRFAQVGNPVVVVVEYRYERFEKLPSCLKDGLTETDKLLVPDVDGWSIPVTVVVELFEQTVALCQRLTVLY